VRFNLRIPCKNCPFGDKPSRIVFACRERAEEIEEHAYRNGFPCHLSATLDEEDEEAGYEFGPGTQHCAGAIGMFLNDGYDTWPGVDNREITADYSKAQAAAFESCEAFFEANARDSGRLPQGEAGTAECEASQSGLNEDSGIAHPSSQPSPNTDGESR
jgi:hypothetical protein